jgi:hypothetical protein
MFKFTYGLFFAILGGYLWYLQHNAVFNPMILLAITLIFVGSFSLLQGIHFVTIKPSSINQSMQASWFSKAFIIFLIYVGTLAYTIASYYHLKLKDWTFIYAFLIAIPFVLIEYQFSIRGNFFASTILGMNAVQIALITMCFYFFNAWLLNHFVLKKPTIWWRELLAFALILGAFIVTTSI